MSGRGSPTCGTRWPIRAGLDPVTVKSFLAFGMLLNNVAALDIEDLDEPWARGVRTRIHPGLFEHITSATNRGGPS